MKPLTWAGLAGFLAVALGAFGAHGLRGRIPEASMALFQTAAFYHLVHAVALTALALNCDTAHGALRWSFRLFGAGILLFSGSLYTMAITGTPSLGWLTPLGGVCLLAGWGTLFARGFHR